MDWDKLPINIVARCFHNYGMVLTRIAGQGEDEKSYKNPVQEWKPSEQTPEFLDGINWKESTGLGLSLGYNDYRAIDIDFVDMPDSSESDVEDDYYDDIIEDMILSNTCGMANHPTRELAEQFPKLTNRKSVHESFLRTCLTLLGLPLTYQWVVRSPHGYHIIFRAKNISKMWSSVAYSPNKSFAKNTAQQLYFSRIELLWSSHLVLPPSRIKVNNKHRGFGSYHFIFSDIPCSKPLYVRPGRIDMLLNYLCGDEGYAVNNFQGADFFSAMIKHRCIRGSDDIPQIQYEDDQRYFSGKEAIPQPFEALDIQPEWLKACGTGEALNKLGILSFLDDHNASLAQEYFIKSSTQRAKYNLACLMAMGQIQADAEEFDSCIAELQYPKIQKEQLRLLYREHHPHIGYSIYVSCRFDGPEDAPRLKELAWIETDIAGNYLGVHRHQFIFDNEPRLFLVDFLPALAKADCVVGYKSTMMLGLLNKEFDLLSSLSSEEDTSFKEQSATQWGEESHAELVAVNLVSDDTSRDLRVVADLKYSLEEKSVIVRVLSDTLPSDDDIQIISSLKVKDLTLKWGKKKGSKFWGKPVFTSLILEDGTPYVFHGEKDLIDDAWTNTSFIDLYSSCKSFGVDVDYENYPSFGDVYESVTGNKLLIDNDLGYYTECVCRLHRKLVSLNCQFETTSSSSVREEERQKRQRAAIEEERNRLNSLSHRVKDNAQAFKDYLDDNDIDCFYHFTDRRNLNSIRQNGGLYSWKYCEDHGIHIPNAGGSDFSRELDVSHGLEDYVRLSFCDDHPMAWRLIRDGADLVLLKIKADVALLEGTLFSEINAADSAHTHGPSLDNLRKVDIAATREHFLPNTSPLFKKHQAEVLVKTFIPVEYIINISDPSPME